VDRYIDIYHDGKEYFINIRWRDDGEQHEVYGVDTIKEVNEIVANFFKEIK